MRRETLAQASGRTIDLGAGTGVNLGLFPEAVTELVLAEPDPHMLAKLRAKVTRGRGNRDRPGASREPALRGRQLRHGRLHPGALHGAGSGSLAERGGPSAPARRPAALRRARPRRGARPGALAGPPRGALALPRRRLSLQPRHHRHDRSVSRSSSIGRSVANCPKRPRSCARWSTAPHHCRPEPFRCALCGHRWHKAHRKGGQLH